MVIVGRIRFVCSVTKQPIIRDVASCDFAAWGTKAESRNPKAP